MSTTTVMSPSDLEHIASNLTAAKMFSLASCVMLFYDIVLTFGEEVERIWMRKVTPVTFLWFLNRYLSPLGYIVIIVSFHDPWTKSVCERYVLYPEALKVVTAFTIGVIFILRIYAIYCRNMAILIFTCLLLACELGIKIWAFTDGTSLQLPPDLVGCILVGKSPIRFVFTWIAELGFDSLVFFLTLWRTISYNRIQRGNAMSLITLIMRDGVIYFGVIFVANLVTVLMFLLAPADIKAVNASFSTLITSLMVSRLILNLRATADQNNTFAHHSPPRNAYREFTAHEPTANYDLHIIDSPMKLFAARRELYAIGQG